MSKENSEIDATKLIMERKRVNCPFTIIHSSEEYRVLTECKYAFIRNNVCPTVYLWTPTSGVVLDMVTQKKKEEMKSWPEVIEWFASTEGDQLDDETKNHNRPVKDYDINICPLRKTALFAFDVLPDLVDINDIGHSQPWFCRVMKDRRTILSDTFRSIFIVSHTDEIPPELRGYCEVIRFPTPGKVWISHMIREVGSTSVLHPNGTTIPEVDLTESSTDKLSHELLGLTSMEVDEVLAIANARNASEFIKNPATPRGFDLQVIREVKAECIRRSGSMTIIHPKGGLELIGGMDKLKRELDITSRLFDPRAKDDGIREPKGFLMVGPGGTGKSQCAKAIAAYLGFQIARLDMGACKGSYVGQSEGNLRKALALANKISPVVLYVDEFEKMWAGASPGSGTLDGGVSSGMLATWLTWMQDEKEPGVLVVAACNDVRGMPGPVIRAGRFDEVIYVGLPGPKARKEIFDIHFKIRGWKFDELELNIPLIISRTKGYSGAEIERIVEKSLRAKVMRADFGHENPPNTEDVLTAISEVTPLSRTHNAELKSLQLWASKVRVLPASTEPLDFTLEEITGDLSSGSTTSQPYIPDEKPVARQIQAEGDSF